MKYPGDTADPKEVAEWMAWVAENEYGLPGILPVMTSCVELTDAWTGPGDVKWVPGYLSAVDHTSVGYFQQQSNWGTYAQRTNADWALRAFCKEAKRIEDDSPADTPEQLGAWCAAVQRPREDLAYLYAEKGYPMAKKLLEGTEKPEEYPHRNIGFDKDGWALDLTTNEWIKSDRKEATLYTNVDGWLWGRPVKEEKAWDWPAASDEPDPNSYYYVERNPTRYSWPGNRDDINKWARYLVDNYNVWCNTYHHHPEEVWIKYGVSREYDSMDVWGPGGRGDPIDPALGDELFDLLFNDPNPPNLEWIIWRATMYGAWNGWQGEPFGTDDFSWHYDHIHCTFV